MKNIDIVYPNLKQGGVYCLAPLIFYNIIKNTPNWHCNLVYLDEGKLKSNLIGFTLQYELDYHNVLDMLRKNEIEIDKTKRKQIIFAGGPVINNNPLTMEKYFDFFVLGEGEETIKKIIENHTEDKKEFLQKISSIEGVYVPGINEPTYHYSEDLNKIDYPLEQPLPSTLGKEYVFGEVFMLEIERGCPFMCKFCPMPTFYGKVKTRSLENIKKIIDEGTRINKRKKVIIYSASFVHPQRKEILKYMLSKGLEFSIPSVKAEIIDLELLQLIKKGGQRTLTLAPEANESLRKQTGKMVNDEQFYKVINFANEAEIEKIKWYFMIGIPNQTQKDLEEMIKFIKEIKIRFKGKTYVSINPFVPKPNTMFSEHKFDKKEIKKQATYLKKELGKLRIQLKLPSLSTAEKVWQLSRVKEF